MPDIVQIFCDSQELLSCYTKNGILIIETQRDRTLILKKEKRIFKLEKRQNVCGKSYSLRNT